MAASKDIFNRWLVDPAFLQKFIRCLVWALACSFTLTLILAITLGYVVSHPVKTKYIYHDSLGAPRELIVTDQPYFTDAQVRNFAAEKITHLYTIDYVHFREQLGQSSTAFTASSWNSWAQAFKDNVDFIKDKKVFLTATLQSSVTIHRQGVNNGAYQWHISFPMWLKWENSSQEMNDLLDVIATIQRTNDPLHPDALEIVELNASRAVDGRR